MTRVVVDEKVALEKAGGSISEDFVAVHETGSKAFSAVIFRGVAGDAEGAALVSGTMPAGDWPFMFVLNLPQTQAHVELLEGEYQVYLLGPRSATFELDLTGSGQGTVKIDDVADTTYVRKTIGKWEAAQQGAVWAGRSGPTFTGDGLGLTGIWATSRAHAQTVSGSCYYGPGAPAPPPSSAFAPGCPWYSPNRGSPAITTFSEPSPDAHLSGHVHVSWPLRAGDWSLGAWLETSGVIERAEALAVWVEFAPIEASE